MEDEEAAALVAWRCRTCGDTFTAHERDEIRCPSCGSADLDHAAEPLL